MAGRGRRCLSRWVDELQQLWWIMVSGVDHGCEILNGDHVEVSTAVLVVGDLVYGAMFPREPWTTKSLGWYLALQ